MKRVCLIIKLFSYFIIHILFFSCSQNYTPKPSGYFRIDFPEKEYQHYDSICPFTFEYPVYGELSPGSRYSYEPCWINIDFPDYKGTIHLTYKEIENNFEQMIEDDWKFVYKGLSQRADAIGYHVISDPELNVFGMIYDISGNAASSVQFFVTDSVRNFMRGSLYFNVVPNVDSLAPVVAFFRQDIIHLVETIEWKN